MHVNTLGINYYILYVKNRYYCKYIFLIVLYQDFNSTFL